MRERWIVVASRTVADIYTLSPTKETLVPVAHFENPQGRLHDQALEADRPGRAFDSAGRGRHAMSTEVSASEHVADRFAAEIAAALESARCRNALAAVTLVAEPTFLGRLKAALDDETEQLVTATLEKGLTDLPAPDLLLHLRRLAKASHPG